MAHVMVSTRKGLFEVKKRTKGWEVATADFLGVVKEVAGAGAADAFAGIVAAAGSVDYAVTSVETREVSSIGSASARLPNGRSAGSARRRSSLQPSVAVVT